jgi:hypothetical protein
MRERGRDIEREREREGASETGYRGFAASMADRNIRSIMKCAASTYTTQKDSYALYMA